MNQDKKNQVIVYIWIGVKLLVTMRYFYDTYTVALREGSPAGIAFLDGILIDMMFAALWIVVSFGGQSQAMLRMRPFAAGGAWALYILMLRVAETNGSVALLARYAGGLGLAYDTLDILLVWLQRMHAFTAKQMQRLRTAQQELTLIERQAQMRRNAWRRSYSFALLLLRSVLWIGSGVLVLRDLYADARVVWAVPAQAASLPQNTPAPLLANPQSAVDYEHMDTGECMAVCTLCSWRSSPHASRTQASRAYAAHTRGRIHQQSVNEGGHDDTGNHIS